MKERRNIIFFALCAFLLLSTACTEAFDIETIDYESVLVVESTITDEKKHQVVKLSRTTTLENSGVLLEDNAKVIVEDSDGNSFTFSQDFDSGNYVSDIEFQAFANTNYTLKINTQDGKNYNSTSVILPSTVEMDKVYAEPATANGEEGIHILVDTYDVTGNAKYFRYEFEETYKIVAPNPSRYVSEIVNHNPVNGTYDIILTQREPEIVCYASDISTGIIQTATNNLSEDKVFRFPVQFISKKNPVIQSRYSILVKQYVQSLESYTFYKTIKELGSVESLLSQGQPGYVAGNMKSGVDPDEKVLGYFEASSTTSKRIYFNYEDFGLEKPPYFVECEVFSLNYALFDDPDERSIIFNYLTYFNYQVLDLSQETIYAIVQPECSVCTSFASNIKPDFWVD